MNSEAPSISEQAYRRLIDTLLKSSDVITGPLGARDARERAEGFRHLLRLVSVACEMYVENGDREHPVFTRHGDDVVCQAPISFPQAVLGCEIEVPTLEGDTKLTIPHGTPTGKVFRISGLGVQHLHGRGRGNQLVQVEIQVPKKLSAEQESLLREYARLTGDNIAPQKEGFLKRFAQKKAN